MISTIVCILFFIVPFMVYSGLVGVLVSYMAVEQLLYTRVEDIDTNAYTNKMRSEIESGSTSFETIKTYPTSVDHTPQRSSIDDLPIITIPPSSVSPSQLILSQNEPMDSSTLNDSALDITSERDKKDSLLEEIKRCQLKPAI